MPTPP